MSELCRVSIEEKNHDRKTSSVGDNSQAKNDMFLVGQVVDCILSGLSYRVQKNVSYDMEDVWALIIDEFDPRELALAYTGKPISNELKSIMLNAARKVAMRALNIMFIYDSYADLEAMAE